MSLRLAARIAQRELRGGVKGFRVFLICLALGVAAIAAVGSVRESIQAGLAAEGASLLGGDASVSLTYRFADEGERAYLADIAQAVSEVVDFRSMAVRGDERGLTQVKAVDAAYPLYGAAELDPPMALSQAFAGGGGLPGAVMAPLLIDRLGLAIGDEFTLGEQRFTLMAALLREPDNATGGFGLGPRTMVRTSDLAASGLLAPGTLFDTEYRLRLGEGADLAALEADTLTALQGSAPRWRDARDGAPGVRVFIDRLGSFLVLVGLAGLAVGGVGVSAAVRAYLDEKTETIAVLKTLGADRRTIFQVYLIQIGALTLVGLFLGLALGAALPILFAPVITASLPLPADVTLHLRPLAEAAFYGVLAALLFTLWPLAQAEEVRAAALFRDAAMGRRRWPRWPYIALTGVLLAVLIGAAAWFTGVAKLALWSAFGIFAAFLALLLAGHLVRGLARGLSRWRMLRGRPILRGALAAVGGPGGEAGSVVLSLGLGLTVLAAVGQIDNNLRGAISRELPDVAPSFFVVDIQPDQIDGVRARLDGDPGVEKVDQAPMLRGVITRINNRPAQEVAGDHWVLRGDRGLTYAATKPARTTLTDGAWWPKDYTGPPQISFAAEEAAEMGLVLGDRLTMNILGRDITGEISSFRDVDFSSAGMGFVLSMNPAALSGAPHSFIVTIYADQASEAAILRDLSNTWPNITVISVREAIGRVTGLMGSIAAAITYGALATVVTGFFVLIGAAAAGERSRTYEAAVLKTLGASRAAILANFALRSAILGAAAGLVAVFAGGMAGWAVTTFVMENSFAFEPVSALAIVCGGILVTVLAGLGFAWRPLAARPAQVLRARE
ncbi:FtsX-like permease family protein [Aliiroseovarius subalbicans]|uniref:ABC transporter permease n=1 Tax=Aliiroseovarius subalbicans TaxID=2925840 RepID=UPI001F57A360|nr:FtsX-like permease family protein [Aliiroseovarius subalbicans]MCI2400650.1 FtsX-like permease family protein [Aliiroseovarius subalbicans]